MTANQQAFLVIGNRCITISLEPLDRDVEVIIVPFSCFWCGFFSAPHPPSLSTRLVLTTLLFTSPFSFSRYPTKYNDPAQGNQD
jgi:hypothetical protein